MAGAAFGGHPALVTSTVVAGDWSRLSEIEFALFGASGALANVALAVLGWSMVRRQAGRPGLTAVVGWLMFALNGWMGVGYLIISPALGFGEWMEVLESFPNRGPARVSMVVTGVFVAGLLWRGTVVTLTRVVGNGASARRAARAAALTRIPWLAGGLLAATAALLAPAEALTGLAVALGTTLGTTWPMVVAASRIAELPVPGLPLKLPRSWPILAISALVVTAFVLVLGRGVDLTA